MTNSNRRSLHFRCERLYAVMHFRVRPWSANASLRALVFVWEGFNFFALTFMLRSSIVFEAVDSFFKVVLWITSETASREIFISMKITELWFKVLWQQQISCK